jgi:hypothetical protein
MTGATQTNTEQLMAMWLRQGLGYEVDVIEEQFDRLFDIQLSKDYTEFEVDALLRPDWKTRIEALARGVQGAIYAPNEARAKEGLKAVANGDQPRVQQQLVTLDWEPPEPAAPGGGGNGGGDGGGDGSGDGSGDGQMAGDGGGDGQAAGDASSQKLFAGFLLERAIERARQGGAA